MFKINASILDKGKDYILLQVGTGLASRAIKSFAKLTYNNNRKDFAAPLPADSRLPSHCAWLIHIEGEWVVCEAHASTGVHAVTLANWLNDVDRGTEIGLYADKADRSLLVGHLGDDYALIDLAKIAVDELKRLFATDEQVDMTCHVKAKLTCSSYLSICQSGNRIAEHYRLNCREVQPFHACMYAIEQKQVITWYSVW